MSAGGESAGGKWGFDGNALLARGYYADVQNIICIKLICHKQNGRIIEFLLGKFNIPRIAHRAVPISQSAPSREYILQSGIGRCATRRDTKRVAACTAMKFMRVARIFFFLSLCGGEKQSNLGTGLRDIYEIRNFCYEFFS